MLFRKRVHRTPTLLQMEAVECGAAALGIILHFYGQFVPLETLRSECGVNRDGSKASNMAKAARKFGMEAVGRRLDAAGALSEARLNGIPLILHWNFNHFLVLEGHRGGKVFLNDPSVGHRTVDVDEFKKAFTGVALFITPGHDFKRGGKRFSVTRAVAAKLATEKPALVFVLITGLLMIIPGLAAPVFDQLFVDEILSGYHPDWMTDLMLSMGLAFLMSGALSFLRSFILIKWQTKLTLSDSSEFLWHVLRLPAEFFHQRFGGEIAMRVSLNEKVASSLTGDAATALLDIFVALFYLALLVQYSLTLTAIGLSFSIINIALMQAVRKRLTEMSMVVQQESGKAMGTAVSGLQVIETLKANGNEADFFSKWSGYKTKENEGMQRVNLAAQAMSVAPAFFNGLNVALIMLVGGFNIMDGLMSSGIFIAFRGLMANFQGPVTKLIGLSQTLQTTEMQMQKLNDVKRYEIDNINYPRQAAHTAAISALTGLMEFREVSFGYSPLDPPLIENLSFTLKPGRWVALIGASGSGKSTVAKLASGLYHEWSGKILFDGLGRADIPKDVLVGNIACVDQDIYLFSGSIRENLSMFDASVPEPDILAGAMDALINDDIVSLKRGYDYHIDENGANFSGGQRQRLEIARALTTNPSLLIFDEATSALDPVTEEAVLTNIRRRGCACLMVAHRLSAFRDCDEIIVLEHGKVVQRGTHGSMMATDGPYRNLVSVQTNAGERA
ncbi:NHLP family bacteriocin export ABC transporter peptidase/permease/ATPase [Synergistales bacterium]|nr:NHLP family bacteriocin export ABC transporter peptidase/permease/ATPase [Synergistales bacterium]